VVTGTSAPGGNEFVVNLKAMKQNK
jgi:hypothetical protein